MSKTDAEELRYSSTFSYQSACWHCSKISILPKLNLRTIIGEQKVKRRLLTSSVKPSTT
jgi:hypothetical protein